MKNKLGLLFFFSLLLSSVGLFGADAAELASEFAGSSSLQDTGAKQPNVLVQMAVLAGVSLLPFAVILLTSFLKMVIVLSLLRNALGVQQAPPNQAINGIAVIMAIYVMFPTGAAMYDAASEFIEKEAPGELFSPESAYFLVEVMDRAKEPLRDFLQRNTLVSHENQFYSLAEQNLPAAYKSGLQKTDFFILIPAYITSQIKGAFEIGVVIYLPFFVIDLVTSNILLAMGMMMLSPLTIALPLKLLLVVMVDGWTVIIRGIVQTFR